MRTVFTTITSLPNGVSRETVLITLHTDTEMIDLNPSHEERHKIKSPPEASPEEYHTQWYQITDKVSYFPGVKGQVSFKACFHHLSNGMQTHVYAPMGLDIKQKWTLCGNLPHEPVQPAEIGIGAPVSGLYLREDVDMRCNFFMTRFVRKQLKESLAALVARLLVKSQIQEAAMQNHRLTYDTTQSFSPPGSPPMSPPLSPPLTAPLAGPGGKMTLPPFYQGGGQAYGDEKVAPGRASFPPYGHQGQQQHQYQQIQPYNPQDYSKQGHGVTELDNTPKGSDKFAISNGPIELP